MTVVHIKDYPKIKTKLTTDPRGDIDSIVMWQEAEEIGLCCICCACRWTELVAVSMMEKPQWMGDIKCPDPDCVAVGFVVRG